MAAHHIHCVCTQKLLCIINNTCVTNRLPVSINNKQMLQSCGIQYSEQEHTSAAAMTDSMHTHGNLEKTALSKVMMASSHCQHPSALMAQLCTPVFITTRI